jgi:uncharacterized membrane protein
MVFHKITVKQKRSVFGLSNKLIPGIAIILLVFFYGIFCHFLATDFDDLNDFFLIITSENLSNPLICGKISGLKSHL